VSESFINYEVLRNFSLDGFKARQPFPWANVSAFLTPEGFQRLYNEFPSLELFEKHEGIERIYGQRSHNRYYLAYETSIYHQEDSGNGVLKYEQLPAAWAQFIEELETGELYQSFMKTLFDVPAYRVRYAWHAGFNGSEVSPHLDATEKIGTHIIYFNTSSDWDPAWGGTTLVLGGKRTTAMNPDFADFETVTPAEALDNQSFVFKNTPYSWHGATALTCPPGKYRRLFNVIFETPSARAELNSQPVATTATRRLLRRALTILSK
jgi:hypothetical protein